MVICTYLLIGFIVVNLLLLLNKEIREGIWEGLFCDFPKGIIENYKKKRGIKKIVYLVSALTANIFLLVIAPLVAPIVSIQEFYAKLKNRNNHRRYVPIKREENCLYFDQTLGGAGTIFCKDCGYKEFITSFIHGFNKEGGICGGIEGVQCQSCGKFRTLSWDDLSQEERNNAYCECGGKLENEKPLFCPKCKSRNVKYYVRYIT